MTPVGRALRGLVSSNTEIEHQSLAREARKAGADALHECSARAQVTVQGRIAVVTVAPPTRRSWLEAEVTDGTGTLTLVWMGRRTIPGIEAGRIIRVQGRLAQRGRDRVMYNPHYTLLS